MKESDQGSGISPNTPIDQLVNQGGGDTSGLEPLPSPTPGTDEGLPIPIPIDPLPPFSSPLPAPGIDEGGTLLPVDIPPFPPQHIPVDVPPLGPVHDSSSLPGRPGLTPEPGGVPQDMGNASQS
jgi:hypothetical protein